jgi:hypothetical protein
MLVNLHLKVGAFNFLYLLVTTQTVSNPIYDPYDLDVKFEDKVKDYSGKARDSIKKSCPRFYFN